MTSKELYIYIIYINSLSLLVYDGRAGHGLSTSTNGNWARAQARTGHGRARHNTCGHGVGGLGTDWARARTDWARTGWAQVDCVRTSRVPTSIYIYIY